MFEENNNETFGATPCENANESTPINDPAPVDNSLDEIANENFNNQITETFETTDEQVVEQPEFDQPQIIVQKERGFAHYVGFALLSVLCICLFFMPGIAITFGVSCIVDLTGAAAWIFSAILSVIAWVIFKIKIQGFKKSFYWYIGLCILVLAILIAIQVISEVNIFGKIITLLSGANV